MTILKKPVAYFDLIEQAGYLERVAGLETAERFLDALQAFSKRIRSGPKDLIRCGAASIGGRL